MAGHREVSTIVVGWVLLLAVLDPTHGSPVTGIDVELAIATRHNGVDDEGGSRGDIISTTKKSLFNTPNKYPISMALCAFMPSPHLPKFLRQ